MSSHILIIGNTGQLASCLKERRAALSNARLTFLDRDGLDLAEVEPIAETVAAAAPDLVINAAAYTSVDKAETEEELAYIINAEAAGEIARGAALANAPVIHISTDYVFDGTCRRSYREDDPVAPLGAYGRSKLAGEQAIADANSRHVIARTAWVYSTFGSNFVKTMLQVGAEQDRLSVVDDQIGNPTSAHDLAGMIFKMAAKLLDKPDAAQFGTFHIAGIGSASWCDLARFVFACAEPVWGRKPKVDPILTEDYPTPTKRPANSRLDTTKFQDVYNIKASFWTHETQQVVARLLGDNSVG